MPNTPYWIWFQLVFGFGTARSHQFLEKFHTPYQLYQRLEQGDVSPNLLDAKERSNWKAAFSRAQELEEITYRKRCHIVTPEHSDYPELLHHIYAKPAALYVKGDLSVLQGRLGIAMVGARRHTKYGAKVANFLAEGLAARDVVVLSGLALGIDTVSLSGAVQQKGKTIGVLACGLDYDYPKGNAWIKRQICENGAVVSEYPMGSVPRSYMFSPRNRILAGMSHGVTVVEASAQSGALVTARYGLEFNRELFVPPGGIFSGTFVGSHNLLKEGVAKLIATPEDIIEEFQNLDRSAAVRSTAQPQQDLSQTEQTAPLPPAHLSEEAQTVYRLLTHEKQSPDQLVLQTSLSIPEILTGLTTLEIGGFAVSHPGGYFTLSVD